jgi:hypothetical protein
MNVLCSIRDVGYVEKITIKRSYKYKTIKAKFRFTKEYENTYTLILQLLSLLRDNFLYPTEHMHDQYNELMIFDNFQTNLIKKKIIKRF